jgi:Spy/CpxP family protein refolding chaperone
MKNSRIRTKALALILSLMLFTFGAKAHWNLPDPQTVAKKQTEWMKKDLSLSEDQTKKVEDINLKYAKKMESIHQNKEKDLQDVLNKDQFEKYKAKKAEHMKNHQEQWNNKK